MSIPIFPTMPVIKMGDYRVIPQKNIRRTEYESGPPRQAPINSRQMVQRPIKLHICSIALYWELKNFIRDDLKFGARWFLWKCPEREQMGLEPMIRCRIVDGEVEYRSENQTMDAWEASFTLETWDAT